MPRDLPDFGFRPANAADFAFAWQVYRDVMKPLTEALLPWREARQKAVVAAALAEDGSALIVVETKEAGWLLVRETRDEIYLGHLYLLPAWQSRGIGSAILAQLKERARQARLPLALDVMTNNPARAFYEHRGFHVAGASKTKVKLRWGTA
jgi:ribosomal protein S18 acetylase RimI-like enzyme